MAPSTVSEVAAAWVAQGPPDSDPSSIIPDDWPHTMHGLKKRGRSPANDSVTIRKVSDVAARTASRTGRDAI
jgi:hypothetical protein